MNRNKRDRLDRVGPPGDGRVMAQHRELDAQTVISDLMLVVVSVVPLALLTVRANDNH
jgi:hypothetical protein